jgi:hypothetical protein
MLTMKRNAWCQHVTSASSTYKTESLQKFAHSLNMLRGCTLKPPNFRNFFNLSRVNSQNQLPE